MKEQKQRTELNMQVSNNPEQDFKNKDYITVRGLKYDEKNKKLIVYLQGNRRGILPYEEASILPYHFPKHRYNSIPTQIYELLHQNFNVKVIENSDDGQIIVSRKTVQKEFIDNLTIGEVIDAEIYKITNFGLFVNLGEGVIALLPITNISKARINFPNKWFSIGEKIKVKITDISFDPIRITVSRKEIYSDPCYERGDIIKVRISRIHDDISYFVEINPGCTGIMDIFNLHVSEIYEGQTVNAIVKKRKSEGMYKLDMLPL